MRSASSILAYPFLAAIAVACGTPFSGTDPEPAAGTGSGAKAGASSTAQGGSGMPGDSGAQGGSASAAGTDAAPNDGDGGNDQQEGGAPASGGSQTGAGSGHSGSAGTGGSEPVDPTPGESRCYSALSGALICEGFEAAQLGGWSKTASGGTAARVASPTFVGEGALESKVTMGGGRAFVSRGGINGLASGTLYLRGYIYVAAGAPLMGVTAVHLSGTPAAVSVLLIDTGLVVVVQPNGNSEGEVVATGGVEPYVIERNQWHCLQLEVAISDTAGSVKLVMDGDRVAVQLSGLDTKPSDGYHNVSAGILYADAQQQAARVLLDELVIDDQPVACDEP